MSVVTLITDASQLVSGIFTEHPWFLMFSVGLFSLLFGSFFNVVMYRYPKRMFWDWRKQCIEFLEDDTLILGDPPETCSKKRSFCPKCKHTIAMYDNIPVVSYLLLGGKCRHCKQTISLRYPAIELLTMILSVAVVAHFGFSLAALAGVLLTWCLIVLSGIDYDHKILPDNIVLFLMWAGLLLSLTGTFTNPGDAIVGAIAGYLVFWLFFHAFKLITGKEGMGYGDFKLMAALGAWLGWQMLPIILLLSTVTAAVLGTAWIVTSKKGSKPFPFGPYLAIAGWIALMWGNRLNEAYLGLMGL